MTSRRAPGVGTWLLAAGLAGARAVCAQETVLAEGWTLDGGQEPPPVVRVERLPDGKLAISVDPEQDGVIEVRVRTRFAMEPAERSSFCVESLREPPTAPGGG